MSTLAYHVLDVFTDRRFAGNPLAVVLDADGLSDAAMQAVTREFNLSETIFVCRPSDPRHAAAVRIFTPGGELPFAGHPTIGCAVLLAGAADRLMLETRAGDVAVTVMRGDGAARAEFTAPVLPRRLGPCPEPAAAAGALGLDANDVAEVAGVWAGGPGFLYVRLATLAALARAAPMRPRLVARDGGHRHGQRLSLRARRGGHVLGAEGIRARMFAPGMGLHEDPATGSAAAILAGPLHAAGLCAAEVTRFAIAQGIEMGRPSALGLTVETAQGAIAAVRVAGAAVPVAEGRIRLPD